VAYNHKPWLNAYDPGVRDDIEIPDISLVDCFDDVLIRFAERPALHFFGRTLNYSRLMQYADRFARALTDNGCRPGDVVGIQLPNVPQYLVAQVGALKAGCATSGISPLLTAGEMAYQLNDSRTKALVTLDALFEHRFLKINEELPHLNVVIVTGILDFLSGLKRCLAKIVRKVPTGKISPLADKKVLWFMDILRRYPDQGPEVKIAPQDFCLIQYTGGTTGVPKGTILTHRNIVANMIQVREWSKPEEGNEVTLSAFPLFHLAGLMLGLLGISLGGAQVLIPDPRDTKHIVKEFARYHPTILVNVPSLYMMLLEEPRFHKLDFSGLKFCISGAAPFPVEGIRALERVIGEGKVVEVYGMTETSPIITMNPRKGKKKIGTVGLPVQRTRVKLVDLETGAREVSVGEAGEIIVQGPQVMQGYLNRPDETEIALRVFQGERWLYTGDVAKMDDEGYFTIVDRSKDMVNVGGFKVFSREVEEKLNDHAAVELCAIIGVPNPKRPGSELVKMVAQLAPPFRDWEEDTVKKEIIAFAKENLSPYKVPKIIQFIDKLPLTPVGKVDKKALR